MPTTTPSRTENLASAVALAGFRAAMTGSCAVRLEETGWIRVTGEDRVRWLNGMVTNSIQALKTGEGCFNFLLNAQGRIQGTAYAWAEADALLLQTDRAQVGPMIANLDRFIIMDDVELKDVSAERAGVLVAGPGAEAVLRAAGLLPESLGGGTAYGDVAWRGSQVRVQQMRTKGVARFELWGTEAAVSEAMQAVEAAGAVRGEAQVSEWLRMLEGTPKFGVDIRDRELPQETGQTEALHFSKGCYLGQEIVERIRSRGAVHRVFGAFRLAGAVPEPGAALTAGGKIVGELTSVGVVPAIGDWSKAEETEWVVLGLGYVRREVLEGLQAITFSGGTAVPVLLPMGAPPTVSGASNAGA